MKREAVTTGGVRRPFTLEVDVPSGFHLAPRAGMLIYPKEVAAICNWDLSTAAPSTGTEDDPPNGWPRMEMMPADGVLLWILVGDVAKDNEVEPWEAGGPLGEPNMPYLAAKGTASADRRVLPDAQPLSEDDRVGCRWSNLNQWNRVIPLAGPDGDPEPEPLYLQLFAFAGGQAGYAAPLANATSSLVFSYS